MDTEQPRDSERRQATVLFADISGFTSMSEKLDPEEVTEIMNGCFTLLERVVLAHGGHVDKYIGDCVMALFGAPKAMENAPRQAVNAAIAMRDALEHFNTEHHLLVPLQIHTGVNSGLVIAGGVGGQVKREFTVMGDAVNVASRLKDACSNGQIYVGADTYLYTKAEFEYQELKLTLKGKKEPVPAYALLSAKPKIHRTKIGASTRPISSAMIGRDQELSKLANRIKDVVRGQGGIVSIIGEAGIGKSRLLAEVSRLNEIEGALLLEGRALSVGQSLSFHPFVDLLKHWAGIADEDDEQAALAKLEAAIVTVAADASGEIFPFVATLMGMRLSGAHARRIEGIEGEALEKLILKSTRDLLRHMASAQPLVLVFEDLHWADLSSIKLIESLLRLARDSRILFVNVFRPDYPETAGRVLQYVRDNHADQHLETDLHPLDATQCDQLVCGLLDIDDLPRATRALIASRAEGNPFYIEEVARSLVDQGALKYSEGRLSVTDKIDAVVIPGTIQEVIMVRVDRLDKATRRVLEVASVIGRSCYHRILAKVMEDENDIEAKLAFLTERQLLTQRRSRRTASLHRVMFSEELEYTFHHALVQETIYQSMLQKNRKELHLRVAQSIESIFADRLPDFYGMLAYHYSRADSLEKAEEYLFKAGDEAVRSAASSEALTYFREASRIYFLLHGDGGDRNKKAGLERNIGLALLHTGNLIECVTYFDRCLEYLGERVPKGNFEAGVRFVANLAMVLFHLYFPRKHFKQAEAARDILDVMYDKARAQTTTDPQRFFFDSIASIRRLDRLNPATVEGAAGKYAGAAALFSFSGISFAVSRRFLQVAHGLIRTGHLSDLFLYRLFLFVHNYFAGNWDEPCEIDDALVQEALRRGQLWDVDSFLGLDGEKQLDLGNFAAAKQRLASISEIIDAYGYDFARSNEYALKAFIPLAQRDLPAALSAVEQYYNERPEELLNLIALGTKSKILILMGDYLAAEETLRKASALVGRLGTIPPFHAGAYRLSRFLLDVCQLEQALVRGDRRQAKRYRASARTSAKHALAAAAKMARIRTEAYRVMGRCYWVLGKQRQAVRWWERSLAEGQRLGARPELARTYLEVAQRFLAAKSALALDGLGARDCLERARASFAEMGLEWDLEQVAKTEPGADGERVGVAA
jgi:class 3 adenylate cyclase/tetratricopeptide (TPR) repeat protein